ncbi:DUF4282 domain-containing protein [Pseudactinotalea sp.]|uniref:DUF4282 domain-containing protein n=1 Tax=Pseudactinotalea sp. TaxID=1926260 RepID=UPI003B3B7FCB
MTENQFGPREGEADDQTRVNYPRQPEQGEQPHGPRVPPPPQQPYQQQPFPQAPQQQAPGYQSAPYGRGEQPAYTPLAPASPLPPAKPGYFKALFDLSYASLGAPKFARVFQLLFMIISGIAGLVAIVSTLRFGSFLPLLLGIVFLPILWLLLNTLVRLALEAVVGIVQTAENSEQMLEIMRSRGGS